MRLASSHLHDVLEEGTLVLDVRTREEFDAGHVAGAHHLPVQELAQRLSELPLHRPIAVYCRSGGRSASAAALLKQAGYRVTDLGGLVEP